ncbi:MAG TPA: hypothetical protein IAA98_06800 [Candidatus Avipropionibacterium avicola]|uniref:Uncharacterized protein n=1 Tax=Candidatus Avipropionibacterium avicola TaxID=2840701 RepID=A0A9D1KLI1_9ACTN|nr:hypothetical protein [Candidatus Avipropionibacterium avicola]
MTSRQEGIRREDEGTTDVEGFIAPSIGLVEHALYFTTAPDVLVKTRGIIDDHRLELPGAVVVWDETVGRRKGSKAVPGSWWATAGSVTMTVVFASESITSESPLDTAVDAVLRAIAAFSPSTPAVHAGDGRLTLDDKVLGQLGHESYQGTEVFVIRLNAATDFSKATSTVREASTRLIDHIDESSLPLGSASTLPNSLSQAIMRELPRGFSPA